MRTLGCICLGLLLLGCKRSPSLPPGIPSELPQIDQADFSLLTPLKPNRRTHLAVDPFSNVYFTQEMADGSDVVFAIGAGDESAATQLTSANIMAKLGGEGTGNIESIAATSDGSIVFFFAGGTRKITVACFGRFDPRANAIQILADSRQLASATGMGASLALARGSVACSGTIVWLLVHHTDSSALFMVRSSSFPAAGPMQLGEPVSLRSIEDPPRMTRDDARLAAGNDESILFLDQAVTALWKIDPSGRADVIQSLVGLPVSLSLPGQDVRGTIVMFAPAGDLMQPRVTQRVMPVNLQTHYPAVLMLRDGQLSAIGRDDLHGPQDYPLYAMQLQQVVYERGRDTWLGYDQASGELVRFRISQRD